MERAVLVQAASGSLMEVDREKGPSEGRATRKGGPHPQSHRGGKKTKATACGDTSAPKRRKPQEEGSEQEKVAKLGESSKQASKSPLPAPAEASRAPPLPALAETSRAPPLPAPAEASRAPPLPAPAETSRAPLQSSEWSRCGGCIQHMCVRWSAPTLLPLCVCVCVCVFPGRRIVRYWR